MNTFAFILALYGLTVYVAYRFYDLTNVREPEVPALLHEAVLLFLAFVWPVTMAFETLHFIYFEERP